MSKWIESEISKIGTVVSGGTPSTTNSKFWNGDILFVTPYDLSRNKTAFIENTERKISREGLENSSANLLPIGSIILSSRAPIGYIAIAKKEFTTNQGCKSIIPNSDFDSEYFYYCFHFYVERIKKYGEGTTFAEISKGDLELVKFPHPKDKTEQRQIATILSTADAVIEKTQAAIAKYKAIKQGMLQDLFTRGIDTVTGKLRPSYQDAPEFYKESKLGWIPREWEVDNLENVTDKIGSGVTPTGGSEIYKTSGVLFIRSQNVLVGSLSIEDAAFITNEIDERMESSRVKPLDVLLNITGASIGRCAYFPIELKAANVNQHVCILRFKNNSKSLAVFASEFMNSDFGQSQINKSIAGGSREGLNFQQIRAFYFPIIPILELEKLSKTIETLSKKLQTEQDFLHKQQQIKAGLMNDLLSGRKCLNYDFGDLHDYYDSAGSNKSQQSHESKKS